MMDTSVYIVLIVLLNSVVALIRNSLNNSAIQEILRKINTP